MLILSTLLKMLQSLYTAEMASMQSFMATSKVKVSDNIREKIPVRRDLSCFSCCLF